MANRDMYSLIIKEDAKSDITEAYIWHEGKQNNLGKRFIDILDSYFEAILINPRAYPIEFSQIRKTVLKTFPFVIVYEIIEVSIVVYAVFHTSQNPAKLKQRLK